MKKKYSLFKIIIPLITGFIITGCKIPYEPKLKPSDTNSLIVEGFIDGSAPVVVKLSRSRMLSNEDTAARKYELGARVIVEDDKQDSYPLSEMGNGIYISNYTLPLSSPNQYRLHIFTSDNVEYVSDFVPFKNSPLIDSIGWEIKDGGVQVYVNTHDQYDTTRYYRWEYNETWEYHSEFPSFYQYNPKDSTVTGRSVPVQVCWQSDNSTNLLLGSSAKLAHDVIYQMPLSYIQPHDQKLSFLYSVLIKQYALDLNGYNYWSALKSNTESMGSIFDPQPNEMNGNIHCLTNPAVKVVGYISAGNHTEKRVFISNTSLPADWNPYSFCLEIDVPNNKDSLNKYFGAGYDPIDAIPPPPAIPVKYSASNIECVDCTSTGGTTSKPSFWP